MNRYSQQMAKLGFHLLHPSDRIAGDVEPLIHQFETLIGVRLSEDYREFLSEFGGAFLDKIYEAPIAEPGHSGEYACPRGFFGFYKPDTKNVPHSLDLHAKYMTYKARIPSGFIPIAHAIGGNLICLRVTGPKRGSNYYWDHESESDVLFVAPSFDEFLNALVVSDGDDDDENE